jgi:hypothetical protein
MAYPARWGMESGLLDNQTGREESEIAKDYQSIDQTTRLSRQFGRCLRPAKVSGCSRKH